MTTNIDLLKVISSRQSNSLEQLDNRVADIENAIYDISSRSEDSISVCALDTTLTGLINKVNNYGQKYGITMTGDSTAVDAEHTITIPFPNLADYQVEGYIFISAMSQHVTSNATYGVYGFDFGSSINTTGSTMFIPIISESIIPSSQLQPYLKKYFIDNGNTTINTLIDGPNKIYSINTNSRNGNIVTKYENDNIVISIQGAFAVGFICMINIQSTKIN